LASSQQATTRPSRWLLAAAWCGVVVQLALLLGKSFAMPVAGPFGAFLLLIACGAVLPLLLAASEQRALAGCCWRALACTGGVECAALLVEQQRSSANTGPASWSAVAVALVGGILGVIAVAQARADRPQTLGGSVQLGYELLLLALSAQVLLGGLVAAPAAATGDAPPLLLPAAVAALSLLASATLFVIGVRGLWWLALALGARAAAIGAALGSLDAVAPWASATALLHTLSWAALGTAALVANAGAAAAPSEGEAWRGSAIWRRSAAPRVTVIAALSLIVLVGAPPTQPTLLLLPISIGYELLVWLRQRTRLRALESLWQARRAAAANALRAEQQRTLALARLIHDQAPPLHGLWSVAQQLGARGQAGVARHALADRLYTHLEHLQLLGGQLRQVLQHGAPSPLRLRRVDVVPVCLAVIDAAHDQAQLRGVQLTMSLAATTTSVVGEPTALRRVLENLVVNALDATPKGGQVLLEVWNDTTAPGQLSLAVRDSGPGLTAEQQRNLVAAGSQPSTRLGPGLGLAIMAELVAALGGSYSITSTPGAGSAIVLRLPYYDGGIAR
jgi:signal transduction histidine kinase